VLLRFKLLLQSSKSKNQTRVYLGTIGFLDIALHLEFQTTINSTFLKLGLFLSSGEGRETPTLLGPLERANFNHWSSAAALFLTWQIFSPEDGDSHADYMTLYPRRSQQS
jgi:hypothetical protein